MIVNNPHTENSITYENYGFNRRMTKQDAPRFKADPMLHKDARLGEDIITNPANVGPGTILRGALATKAKATPFIIHLSHAEPYQVSAPLSQAAARLLASISGPVGGNPNHIDGWQVHGEFPIRDRSGVHNSALPPRGIAIDANFIWVAQGARIWRMPHDLSSITEITPSATTIPAINGLTSDGRDLFTTNGTAFYRITITGTTYVWITQATLLFPIAKIGCFTGQRFIGHDSVGRLIREWEVGGGLWRNTPYTEPNFAGVLMLNGFPYVATQASTLPIIQLLPARI